MEALSFLAHPEPMIPQITIQSTRKSRPALLGLLALGGLAVLLVRVRLAGEVLEKQVQRDDVEEVEPQDVVRIRAAKVQQIDGLKNDILIDGH